MTAHNYNQILRALTALPVGAKIEAFRAAGARKVCTVERMPTSWLVYGNDWSEQGEDTLFGRMAIAEMLLANGHTLWQGEEPWNYSAAIA